MSRKDSYLYKLPPAARAQRSHVWSIFDGGHGENYVDEPRSYIGILCKLSKAQPVVGSSEEMQRSSFEI